MRILFIGDVYGKTGREMVEQYLPKLKDSYHPDAIIINAENAAHGKGITKKIYNRLTELGADMLTMGNHTWDNREIFEFIDDAKRMVRPANFPEGTPGTGLRIIPINKVRMAVINIQGRVFLPAIDDPFRTADRLVADAREKTPIIFVDIHAETTSEKLALGRYLDGRVSAVIGTHTHVQTADERIFPGGTAYLSDAGMTGPYNGIIGVERTAVVRRFLTSMPVRFESEEGPGQLSAVIVDIDEQNGKATHIERLLINDDHPFFE
ncbi:MULTISPECIES: TIGR00282 family metallophosphoesterase [unclassified Sporolactobacillus]|uniref:TIGR00282 family metallophosphoesterase n=1 Tax=unclassified Sporolactobacillus TaxID=2628533 RepID=UPI002368E7B7|nr:TIGR00282 family metallophosphoesterase [Sporolactobacillus sp. CQH2019]MDD9147000.1 TIGR00282 family metallophosphoesterase [Sporolactobacillus sp. CQH2019]